MPLDKIPRGWRDRMSYGSIECEKVAGLIVTPYCHTTPPLWYISYPWQCGPKSAQEGLPSVRQAVREALLTAGQYYEERLREVNSAWAEME